MEHLSKSAADSLPKLDSPCPPSHLKQPLSGAESHELYCDWVLMFHYKTQPCLQTDCQQWSSCWGYIVRWINAEYLLLMVGSLAMKALNVDLRRLIRSANSHIMHMKSPMLIAI